MESRHTGDGLTDEHQVESHTQRPEISGRCRQDKSSGGSAPPAPPFVRGQLSEVQSSSASEPFEGPSVTRSSLVRHNV